MDNIIPSQTWLQVADDEGQQIGRYKFKYGTYLCLVSSPLVGSLGAGFLAPPGERPPFPEWPQPRVHVPVSIPPAVWNVLMAQPFFDVTDPEQARLYAPGGKVQQPPSKPVPAPAPTFWQRIFGWLMALGWRPPQQ
jgi:hypothetical protein